MFNYSGCKDTCQAAKLSQTFCPLIQKLFKSVILFFLLIHSIIWQFLNIMEDIQVIIGNFKKRTL